MVLASAASYSCLTTSRPVPLDKMESVEVEMTSTPEAPVAAGQQQKTDGAASAPTQPPVGEGASLQEKAKRHLWMHFTRLSGYEQQEVPIITRGEGCYVWDEHGKRYLDGLSALFCVNIGHGRADIVQAGADQAKELGFFTNWSYAHPRAIV